MPTSPRSTRGADVFAFPSLYEGFGIPILKAMAGGTPVVTAQASPSMPEVAGDAALLVSPHDVGWHALWRLLSEPALCDALILRGRQQVSRFRWERSAEALLEAYASLVGP